MKKGFKHIRQDHCCPGLWISLLPYQDTALTRWARTPHCQRLPPAAFHPCLRNYHRRLHAIRPQKWGCQSSRGTKPASWKPLQPLLLLHKVFFLPWGFLSKQDTSQDTASHCSFCLFVAYQGECQWKKIKKISEVTRHRDGRLKLHTLVQEK